MGLIQAARPGGGGGAITIAGFQNDQHTQETNFGIGDVNILLSQTPVDANAITVDYNGQRLLKDTGWSYDIGTNSIDILFADPYVTDYPTAPYFQIVYAYS